MSHVHYLFSHMQFSIKYLQKISTILKPISRETLDMYVYNDLFEEGRFGAFSIFFKASSGIFLVRNWRDFLKTDLL